MIYEINHIWTAEMKWKWRNDRRIERNLCNCVKKPEKISGLQRGLNPFPRDTGAMLYQLSYQASDFVHIRFISYIINTHLFHGNIWTNNWPAPNVSGFIAQLVEHRTGIARSRVQTLLKSWFFSGFFTQLHKLRSLRRSFLHFHFWLC